MPSSRRWRRQVSIWMSPQIDRAWPEMVRPRGEQMNGQVPLMYVADDLAPGGQVGALDRSSWPCHLNRRFPRESWSMAVQPMSFIARSISARMRPSALSTPA